MNRFFVFVILCFFCNAAFGQVGHGGKPLMSPKGEVVKINPNQLDIPRVASSDFNRYSENEKGRPLRFAHPAFVELTPHNSGNTRVLDDGRLLWQLKIV